MDSIAAVRSIEDIEAQLIDDFEYPICDLWRDELSWVRTSPASGRNTQAHSARAVVAKESRESLVITKAHRSRPPRGGVRHETATPGHNRDS